MDSEVVVKMQFFYCNDKNPVNACIQDSVY